MRQVFAILGDSFRESADRRSLLVLLLVSLLPILFCFSLGFETQPLGQVIAEQAEDVDEFRWSRMGSQITEGHDVDIEVRSVRDLDGESFGAELTGGHAIELAFPSAGDVDELAAAFFRFGREPGFEDEDPTTHPIAVDGVRRDQVYLERRFAQFGWDHVAARETEPGIWEIAVRSEHPHEVVGGFTVTAGFGSVRLPVPDLTLAEFVVALQSGLAQSFVGFIGMLIALSACGAFVPNMLQKGTLDLVLARPIGRTKLLLSKYVGGLWFVTCLATFVVGGCWLGLTVGSGYSNPWFLASIGTLVAGFAVLYSVSVLVGIVTRSTGVATLIALAIWFLSSTVVSFRHMLRGPFGSEVPSWVTNFLEGAYTVLPKIKDLDVLSTTLMSRAHLSDAARARQFGALPDVDWMFSLSSTAAFTVAMLAIAVWMFRRRDY